LDCQTHFILTPPLFEYTLIVPPSAIDVMGHVNNVVYLDWVQTAASKHWNHATASYFGDEDLTEERVGIKKMAWVVLDHHISYKAEALEGEALIIRTFVEKMSGVRSERHTVITRKSDQKIIITAVTNWCLLKMPEAKPMRIPEEIRILF